MVKVLKADFLRNWNSSMYIHLNQLIFFEREVVFKIETFLSQDLQWRIESDFQSFQYLKRLFCDY